MAASSTIAAQASPSLVSASLVATFSSADTSPPTSAGSISAGAFSDTLTSTNSATREISASGSSSALVSPASLENKTGQKAGELSTSSKGQSIAHLEQSSLTHFVLIEQEASLAESWVRLLSSVRSLRLFFFADDGTSCINRFTES